MEERESPRQNQRATSIGGGLIVHGTRGTARGIVPLCSSTFYGYILARARARARYSGCLEVACTVRYMKQRALPAFGHTILHGRSDGQKETRSLCAHRKSHCICLADQCTCAFADGLPAPRPTKFILPLACPLPPSLLPRRPHPEIISTLVKPRPLRVKR